MAGFDVVRFSLLDNVFCFYTLPTTDLYFLNVGRRWLKKARDGEAPLRRLGANCFATRSEVVVCRRDSRGVIDRVLKDRTRRLIYVIDDDLWAAEHDDTLPNDYRRRLIDFRDTQHRRLVDQAETIAVPSVTLAERYASRKKVVVIEPHWSDPFADAAHFDELEQGAPLRIAYLGSTSHAADRGFAAAVIERLLADEPRIVATMVGSTNIPASLLHHQRFHLMKPCKWSTYRARVRDMRFHIILYPLLDTPFNRGRSRNKQIEHAVAGGVGVYSRDWEFAPQIKAEGAGLLAENCIEAWVDVVRGVLANPCDLKRLHAAALAAAGRANDPEPQQRFWSTALEVDGRARDDDSVCA